MASLVAHLVVLFNLCFLFLYYFSYFRRISFIISTEKNDYISYLRLFGYILPLTSPHRQQRPFKHPRQCEYPTTLFVQSNDVHSHSTLQLLRHSTSLWLDALSLFWMTLHSPSSLPVHKWVALSGHKGDPTPSYVNLPFLLQHQHSLSFLVQSTHSPQKSPSTSSESRLCRT